jgi:carboxymethylenebutenolidase
LTIVLYAGWLTASEIPLSSPEPTLELTSGIKGRLVYVVGDADHVITEEQRTQIAKRLEDEGVPHDFVLLPGGIPHAFLSEDTPSYHAEAAESTWRLIKDALAAELPRG